MRPVVCLKTCFSLLLFIGFITTALCVVIFYSEERYWTPAALQDKGARHLGLMENSTVENATIKSKVHKKVVILYWTKTFRYRIPVNVNPKAWPFFYAGNNCPIECELTADKKRVGEASALVVYASNMGEMPPDYLKNLTWIMHSNENPIRARSLTNPKFMSQFNYSVTYRLDSDFPCPEFNKPHLDLPVPFAEKKGLVMFAITHCGTIRTEYVRRLMQFIQVDSYGKCLKNKEGLKPRYTPQSEIYEYAQRAVRELERGYKFSLIFPNADCHYYMTEKIHNALSAGSVPVWMGTDKIDEILQWGNLKHSIIKVKGFDSPEKLAKYLKYLAGNETAYNTYLKWKYEGFQFPKEYYKSVIGQWWDGLPLFCRVCMRIAKDPKGHSGLPTDRCDGDEARTVKKWLTKKQAMKKNEHLEEG